MTADVWSLGTTLWQLFSYGEKPPKDLLPAMYKSVNTIVAILSNKRLYKQIQFITEIHDGMASSTATKVPNGIIQNNIGMLG